MAIRSKDVSLVPRKFLLEQERRGCSKGAFVRLSGMEKKLGACHGQRLTINCANKVTNKTLEFQRNFRVLFVT